MKPCNLLPDSAKYVHASAFILALSALIGGVSVCSSQKSRPEPLPLPFFDERPFQLNCADRPSPPPPGVHAWFTVSPQAPYARTHLDTVNIPLREVAALTIAAEPLNWIKIGAARQDHWTIHFCAKGEGDSADEANGYMQKVSMQRTGSLITLNKTDARGLTGGQGELLLEAPVEAPVTVHSDAAVEIHDMAGPVRIAAMHGRAVVLNTSGLVNVAANLIDFAGSQGDVSLSAPWDINIEFTAQQFRGNLNAYADRQVLAILPPDFQTPIRIYVNRPKDFICHADICSKMKQDRENNLYRFTYGDVANAPAPITLRSENAQVTLETTPQTRHPSFAPPTGY